MPSEGMCTSDLYLLRHLLSLCSHAYKRVFSYKKIQKWPRAAKNETCSKNKFCCSLSKALKISSDLTSGRSK